MPHYFFVFRKKQRTIKRKKRSHKGRGLAILFEDSSPMVVRGVARGKCMWKQGRRSGQDRFVTQLCPAGGLGGAVSPPAEPRKQTHVWHRSGTAPPV